MCGDFFFDIGCCTGVEKINWSRVVCDACWFSVRSLPADNSWNRRGLCGLCKCCLGTLRGSSALCNQSRESSVALSESFGLHAPTNLPWLRRIKSLITRRMTSSSLWDLKVLCERMNFTGGKICRNEMKNCCAKSGLIEWFWIWKK